MFRAIYQAAEGTARVRGLNGRTIYSERFKVRRGVVQGDIISPVFFVLAMEQIFRLHDNEGDGITMGNHLNIGVLGYAHDAALMSASTEVMSKRVTEVSVGSKVDADMIINKKKTKTLQVEKQEEVTVSTMVEMLKTEAEYKHPCKFCPRRFKTERGKKIHMTSCKSRHGLTDESFEINDHVSTTSMQHLARWNSDGSGCAGRITRERIRGNQRDLCESKDAAQPSDIFGRKAN